MKKYFLKYFNSNFYFFRFSFEMNFFYGETEKKIKDIWHIFYNTEFLFGYGSI
jgi:hypothetical protein